MKTNNDLPEKESNKPQFNRQTIIVGEPEKKKSDYSFLLMTLIVMISFGSMVYHNVDWNLVKEMPTIQEKPKFFKTLKHKQYFKSVIVPTVVPPLSVEPTSTPTSTPSPKEEVAVNIVEQRPTPKPREDIIISPGGKIIAVDRKRSSSYANVPGYYDYDDLIISEAKKYKKIRPLTIKAIIEQESRYNPRRMKYEAKWERDYGYLVKKRRDENIEEWRMNFHSFGLMQISYILHKDFCGLNSFTDLFNPTINIACGIKLFDACIESGHSETYCIKKHNGSGKSTEGYKNEVLGRMARIMSVQSKLTS